MRLSIIVAPIIMVLAIACNSAHSGATGANAGATAPPDPAGAAAPIAPRVPQMSTSASAASSTASTLNSAGAAAAIGGNTSLAAVSGGAGGVGGVPASAGPAVAPSGPSGFEMDSKTGELVFRTDAIKLPAGKESYVCFAASLDHDVVVDGFSKGRQAFVHHIQFVQTLAPEPEGQSECNVLFRITWLPIFLAGAGPSELRLDEGVGYVLPQSTQLMAQLHLLNASDNDIDQQVEIRMHLSSSPNPTAVSPWAIGSSEINLAPGQAGQAQNVCTVHGSVDLVAVFPHMHMLGTRLTVEAGKSMDTLQPLYKRDPYDFDDQHMEKFKASLQEGDVVRVTCNYNNDTDTVAQFGESTHDEMCFFIGYTKGDPPLADCPNLWDPVFAMLWK